MDPIAARKERQQTTRRLIARHKDDLAKRQALRHELHIVEAAVRRSHDAICDHFGVSRLARILLEDSQ